MENFSNFTTPAPGNCSPYDARIYSIVAAVTAGSGAISVVANVIALVFIVLFKWWSFFSQRLVIYLLLANTCTGVSTVLLRIDYNNEMDPPYNDFCQFSGFLSQVTGWMVLNTYICIMASLLLKVNFNINFERLDIAAVLLIFVSPLVVSWIPFAPNVYGKAGAWCWIMSVDRNQQCDPNVTGQIMQIVLWYLPLYLVLVILIIIYSIVLAKVCRNKKKWRIDQSDKSERQNALKYSLGLMAFPLIYFLTNIFPLINRLQGLFRPNNPSPTLWFISGIFYPQQGTGVVLIFLWSLRHVMTVGRIKAAWDNWFHRVKINEYPIISTIEQSAIEYMTYKTGANPDSTVPSETAL